MAQFLDVFEDATKNGCKIPQEEYLPEGKYPIIDQGQKYIAGYTDREKGLYTDVPAILFGDHTRIIKYVDEPFFLGADGVKLLKAKNKDADYKYLYYALCSAKIPDTGYNRHFKWLKELDIPIPEARTQEKIVVVLNRITDLIDSHKRQLLMLDELVKSRFVEMFGDPERNPYRWEEALLEKHLEIVGGFAFKSDGFVDKGVPVLRIRNINSGHFLPVNLVFWQEDPLLERYRMYPGDLVMSLTGTVGKNDYGNVCILGNEYPAYYLNQRNAKLEVKPTINKYYLSEILKFPQIKKRLTGISRGVRQANISNKDITNLCIPVPPMSIQKQFAAFVEQTNESILETQQSLKKYETLKNALMQQYFH